MQQETVTQLLRRAASSGGSVGAGGAVGAVGAEGAEGAVAGDAGAGNKASAVAELLPIVYDELRSLAASLFSDQKAGHTLQPTAIVHEAYLKLVDQSIDWQSRRQFFAVAASAMRSILVDHARRKGAAKRSGGLQRVPLDQADATPVLGRAGEPLDAATILAIDEAMTRLAEFDPRKAELVEMRFFAGLTSEEAADALGISRSTAAEEWRTARAWLYSQLKGERR
jgi:RNA polymerase sigma-70 factor, ECF subfamily